MYKLLVQQLPDPSQTLVKSSKSLLLSFVMLSVFVVHSGRLDLRILCAPFLDLVELEVSSRFAYGSRPF